MVASLNMSGGRHDAEQPGRFVESADVPPTRFEFRLDDALKAAAQAEAENAGEDLAEFVRGCIRLRLAQITTVRALQAGVDPEMLLDPRRYAEALAEIARQHKGP